jgi:hypothetical protein
MLLVIYRHFIKELHLHEWNMEYSGLILQAGTPLNITFPSPTLCYYISTTIKGWNYLSSSLLSR